MKVFKVTFEMEYKGWITHRHTMVIYAKDLDNAKELFEKWKAHEVDDLTLIHGGSFECVTDEPCIVMID